MRHHPHHVALAVEHAGDIAQRAVGVVQVAESNPVFGFQFVQRTLVGVVAAFPVRDGQPETPAALGRAGERRIGRLHPQRHRPADEFQPAIAHQRARQQPSFHQNLESVAHAQHQPARGRELLHRVHHRRKLGDGAAAQVIAVSKTARQNDCVQIAERRLIVPDIFNRLPKVLTHRVKRVVVAVAAGKNNDSESHDD